MDIVLLNVQPDYDVIVPLICTCKRLRDTLEEHTAIIRPELHGITVVHPELGAFWYDYVRGGRRECGIDIDVRIVADKHWYGLHLLSYLSMSSGTVMYTRITVRGQTMTIYEGPTQQIQLFGTEPILDGYLCRGSSRFSREKFVKKARRFCDYLGLSAQQMLAAINEILG